MAAVRERKQTIIQKKKKKQQREIDEERRLHIESKYKGERRKRNDDLWCCFMRGGSDD